jgi:hypothetical protein
MTSDCSKNAVLITALTAPSLRGLFLSLGQKVNAADFEPLKEDFIPHKWHTGIAR